jgi:hypothetical protein
MTGLDDRPVRIQLSRRKGFNLQAASLITNGRLAVNVTRPTRFGNPFKIGVCGHTAASAVAAYREQLVRTTPRLAHALAPLRGKNLACWCAPDAPCHADVLLELAALTAQKTGGER